MVELIKAGRSAEKSPLRRLAEEASATRTNLLSVLAEAGWDILLTASLSSPAKL